jgi:Helix-turn-helix domain
MSWQAVTWVLEQSQSTLGARLVLLSIASHANREGKQSWPSVETICIETRLSRREVQYALRDLETMGELVTHVRRAKTNSYELSQVEVWVGAQSLHPQGRNLRQKGAQSSAPEPLKNSQKKNLPEKQEEILSVSVGEPSKPISDTERQAEVDRLIIGRGIKTLAKQKQIPHSTMDIEQQKQELRKRGFLQ